MPSIGDCLSLRIGERVGFWVISDPEDAFGEPGNWYKNIEGKIKIERLNNYEKEDDYNFAGSLKRRRSYNHTCRW